MITISLVLMTRIVELLEDIARMKPGFEIYEKAKKLNKDLLEELKTK